MGCFGGEKKKERWPEQWTEWGFPKNCKNRKRENKERMRMKR
jgi:hypothetical protein